ncbi:DUF927 domain-containing protein [Methanosarcina sp. UBA5]|uniref:phage NrS-1 polymerase family protein n=1 Tax=Methanosarcina sp. UBA5 TaxID=1915593 RepID=UPI0025F9CC18|nr:DUF927 domain-containing protein [Methanosarcina sp. UBA5]
MAEKYLPVNPDGIPQLLKDLKQWLVWKVGKAEKGKKRQKLCFSWQKNNATGKEELCVARWSNPDSWMTFETALKVLKEHKDCKGLQFVLPEKPVADALNCPKIVGVDFDNVTVESIASPDHANLDPTAATFIPEKLQEILNLGTYAELSPSGHGLRALCLGEFPEGEETHKNNAEVYQYGKLLTITGHRLNSATQSIEYAQEALTALRSKYFKQIAAHVGTILPKTPVSFSDDEILEKLINEKNNAGDTFKKLFYEGDLVNNGNDHSEADYVLVGKICFYTQDEEQIDRIFRRSKLFRDKWDESRGHFYGEPVTYGQRTIRKALLKRTCVYTGKQSRSAEGLDLYPFNCKESGIYKNIVLKSGDEVETCIASTPCQIIAMGVNIDRHNEILYKLKIKNIRGDEKFVWKTTAELLEKAEVLKLHQTDMQFKEKCAVDLIEYFDIYMTQTKGKLPVEDAVSVNGWKKNFTTFVVGSRAITAEGVREILPIDNPTAENYAVAGSLENWIKGAKYIINFPAVRFKMYNAFAATLLRLRHMPSYLLDQHARTGQLKSDSSELVASMFGNPLAQQAAGSSTTVGVLGMLTYCVDLPTFMDETSQNMEAARKLAYSVGNVGKRLKGRNDGKTGIIIPTETTTVLEMTGENPIIPENSNGGEDVRVLPLTEGVDTVLAQKDIADMKFLIEENYGHIIELYIQELLTLKDQLKDIYNENLERLPTVKGISENRVKRQYAVAATAGEILERVFNKIGSIDPKDPVEICTRYFNHNVAEVGFTADHIKVLRAVYNWFVANKVYFEDPETAVKEISHEMYGCVKEKDLEQLVCFNEGALKKFILKEFGPGKYETVTNAWKDDNILNTSQKSLKTSTGELKVKTLKTKEIRIGQAKVSVIQIPLNNFYKYLSIPEEEQDKQETSAEEPNDTNNASQVPQTTVSSSLPVVTIGDDIAAYNALESEGLI